MKRLPSMGLVTYFALFGLLIIIVIVGTLSYTFFTNPPAPVANKPKVVAIVPPTATATATTMALPTATPTLLPTATATPLPPTPTATPVPPTPTLQPTATAIPPTPTPTPFVKFADRFKYQLNDQVTQLKPGVIQINRIIGGQNPLHTHIILFDLTAPEFSLAVAVQNDYLSGVAPTSKIASSHEALAAVNGDLFGGTGLPQGLTILDSRVAVSPKHRATFAWTKDNQPFIGYFTSQWTWDSQVVAANTETHSLQQLNTPCKAEQLCIYNDLYAGMPYQQGDIKVLLDPDNVVVAITQTVKVKIPDNYQILWGLGGSASWLRQNMKVGDQVKLNIHTDEPLDKYKYAVSGGPIILKNGEFNQDCLCNIGDCTGVPGRHRGVLCEEFTLDWKLTHYLDVKMPRVGVGFDKNKQTLIVVEVDGYQPGFSVGIRQDDFAKLFADYGADTAMELDGGGSATMWANGKLVSRPSDGNGYVERWVPDALLFYWKTPKPPVNLAPNR